MHEVREFCQRVLGVGPSADDAADEALASQSSDRVSLLAAASQACRKRAEVAETARGMQTDEPALIEAEHGENGLFEAVAMELASATARLPERQREALALRERSRLSYAQISEVMGIDVAATASLLARGRLRLYEERRGAAALPPSSCAERDRALRAFAQRQDAESLSATEQDWLAEHLEQCDGCAQAHAAMLEASVCYRAWSLPGASTEEQPEEAFAPPPMTAFEEPSAEPTPPAPPTPRAPPTPPAPPTQLTPPTQPAFPTQPASPTQPALGTEPTKSGLWSRFRAALAADARK